MANPSPSASRPEPAAEIVRAGAAIIWGAFRAMHQDIRAVMRRAQERFEASDWAGLQADGVERLDIPERHVQAALAGLRPLLGERATDRAMWAALKDAYVATAEAQPAEEIAKTFFTTVTRRIFGTVGIDPEVEFRGAELEVTVDLEAPPVFVTYTGATPLELARASLAHAAFRLPFADLERDAGRVAQAIEAARAAAWGAEPVAAVDLLQPVFFRNKSAFLVGRLRDDGHTLPLVIALRNAGGALAVDAVLLDEDEVSIIFSFTRSYFHVDLERPAETVQFLSTLMPWKRVAELYMAVGFPRHGKTELYRDLLRHLDYSDDRFVPAPGDRGMVMIVFTLPSYELVFKVIRDQFAYPKTTTRQDVLDKYALVFKHDRAGRLVDAQEFRALALPRARFAPEVLEELLGSAASSVTLTADQVILQHCYAERRMTPLNLYLREASPAEAREAVLDYGLAIRDLAATNIFPGDLLLKNFGVTRHKRVIFYDYDELTTVTDCVFRDLPQAGDDEDEWRAEAWYYVGEKDIFPEEFLTFLGLQGDLRQAFLDAHADLLTAPFWRKIQTRHRAGEVLEVLPYRASRRFSP
ncbi:MAG: bifunctional isocitrate dehydrogenase kinase/phosphatase [Anaerolineales bacterium]|nr:bifunctional isocitrate dehydrogenase kinase/phosphatase [Anaerolineales bacterium]